MEQTPPEQQRDAALLELARLRAGLAAGLSPDQSARLRGGTDEELAADAQALAVAFGVANPLRQPSASGSDVGSAHGSMDAGEQRYKAKHPEGQKFQHGGYTLERA
ncbi:hypothetical protein ACWD5Q_34205 [Streptomyces sp. NPDC002513]